MAINHKNFAQTTLAAAITTTNGTSITVTSETSFPAVNFIISIDTEAMLVTNVATTTWTVTRGYEGSTAATHTNGTAIYHDWSAAEADSTVHGPSSATDGNLAVFDTTTGKLIKDGGACSAAGLALLDDADAAEQLTTLGAAARAPVGASYTPSSGSQTVALDVSTNNMHVVTGHANGTAITFTVTGATNNQPFIVMIKQGATTASTITAWFATVSWCGGTAPTLSTGLGKTDTFGFIRTGSNTYTGYVVGQNA